MMSTETILTDCPAGSHFATIERTPEALAKSATLFLEAGLREGAAIIMATTPTTHDHFLATIQRDGFDAEALQASGQLIMVDAAHSLAMIMKTDMPDWNAFQEIAGGAVMQAEAFGGKGVRVYGEMVNLLWQSGRAQAAIRLEEFWNDLARKHDFALFCGYVMDGHNRDCYAGPLHEIGRTHAHVLPTEEDDRFATALESACMNVYGIPVSLLLKLSRPDHGLGEGRLPTSWRTLRWLMKSMPVSGDAVFALTLRYYRDTQAPAQS